jgi:hypothetical protein
MTRVLEEPYHLTAIASSAVRYGENVYYLALGAKLDYTPI